MLSRRVRSERGQFLILFMFAFSLVLALGAFAIDQGFWYGRHTVSQKDADAAARAGAIAQLGDSYKPCKYADATASENGSALTFDLGCEQTPRLEDSYASTDCPASGISGPFRGSMTATVIQNTPSLFARFFGIDSINVGATSTACVGSVTKLRADLRTKPDAANEALPIVLQATANGTSSCFANGMLSMGRECVIFGALKGGSHYDERWYAAVPSPD